MVSHSIARRLIPLALAAGLTGFTNPASAVTFLEVNIDTSSLTGTAQLAFDLTNGDGVANNTAIIMDTGGGGIGPPGNWTLSDTDFFNELLLPVTLGNSIRFTLSLTENFAGGPLPDQFALFLVDFSSPIPQPLFDTSGGGALFAVDLGVVGGLQIYQATTSPAATWTVTNTTIPEPGVLLLFATGLLGLVCRRWRCLRCLPTFKRSFTDGKSGAGGVWIPLLG